MEKEKVSNLISPIEEVIADAKNGKMFILVDQEDRENLTQNRYIYLYEHGTRKVEEIGRAHV